MAICRIMGWRRGFRAAISFFFINFAALLLTMASYLQIDNLTKSYGERILFEDVSFGVSEGEKIGIIAKNGTGKSTLLRIIAGKESADSGEVVFRKGLRVGFLEQTPVFGTDDTALDACMSGDGEIPRVIAEYEKALLDGNADRLNDAIHEMDCRNAWDYEERFKQLLTQLKIKSIDTPVSKMSGGQQKRIALARVILESPDMIILDEPTNHLDIEVIEWLEGYLTRSRVTLLMVTHDRYFLDRVCNRIIEIDNRSIYSYDGNYDYYIKRRQERIDAMSNEMDRVKNRLRKEQEWMRRQPQARAGKAKFRIDAFYDLKKRSETRIGDESVSLDVGASYIGSKIFEADGISKRFGDKVILDDFSYTFIVPADRGEWNVGETVRFGYYSQEGIAFDNDKKVIDAITEIAEDITVNEKIHYSPMQFLKRFLFSPADQQKYIHTLSGGEKCRLHLATVLMRSPNFLILDEPTNDLDIVTLGILEEYLRDFDGCLIVVSHDRFFLDSIVDHIFVFEGDGKIKDFPGSYSQYREWCEEQRTLKEAEAERVKKKASSDNVLKKENRNNNRMSFKERREFETLTAELDSLNKEKSELDALFNSGGEIADIAEKSARYSDLCSLIDEKELRWLELSEKE